MINVISAWWAKVTRGFQALVPGQQVINSTGSSNQALVPGGSVASQV